MFIGDGSITDGIRDILDSYKKVERSEWQAAILIKQFSEA